MKQLVKVNDNFDEIEYHEIRNGVITYSLYTRYHYDLTLKKFTSIRSEMEDSEGWLRKFNIVGMIYEEKGSPYIRDMFSGHAEGNLTTAFGNNSYAERCIEQRQDEIFEQEIKNSISQMGKILIISPPMFSRILTSVQA